MPMRKLGKKKPTNFIKKEIQVALPASRPWLALPEPSCACVCVSVSVHIQSTLIIHRFCICKFNLLGQIYNPKINPQGTLMVIHGHEQKREKFASTCTFPATVGQSDVRPSCFSFHTVNKHPFCSPQGAHFFAFLCFAV